MFYNTWCCPHRQPFKRTSNFLNEIYQVSTEFLLEINNNTKKTHKVMKATSVIMDNFRNKYHFQVSWLHLIDYRADVIREIWIQIGAERISEFKQFGELQTWGSFQHSGKVVPHIEVSRWYFFAAWWELVKIGPWKLLIPINSMPLKNLQKMARNELKW